MNLKKYQLPNNKWVYHINDYETDFVFNEIYIDEVYSPHGLNLPETAIIIDIGANIGLFSLYMAAQYPESKIYAYEPVPQVFDALQANMLEHAPQTQVYNYGVSDKEKTEAFYFYPGYSVLSGCHVDAKRDKNIIINGNNELEKIVTERLNECICFQCPMITLSNIIQTHSLQSVDLLKIDVEGSELAILQGISESDWYKIKYILIEVHSKKDLDKITAILENQQYQLTIEKDPRLNASDIYSVFAERKSSCTVK